ncbi:MAG: hypothetical protein CL941_04875 [Desulfobacter sp.]|nr:hypothetical protein [Desulfobacter sp.]
MVLFEPVTAILDKTVSSGRILNGIIFFATQNSICLFPKKAQISSVDQLLFTCNALKGMIFLNLTV